MYLQPMIPKNQPNIHLHNTMTPIRYRFIHQKQLNFGEALYIVGNIEQLGEWNITCAIRLDCYMVNFWIVDIQVPIDTEIEYKYFISSYEHHFTCNTLKIESSKWIGDTHDNNLKLFLSKRESTQIQQTKKNKSLKIMSFNLRYENNNYDLDERNWKNRKQNCLQVIKEKYPSIIGVQQVKGGQKKYLLQNFNHLYHYIGVSRSGRQDDEQVGIFYDKQRFLVVDYGFRWISESRCPGSMGYGAPYPRYYTYMILEDTYVSQKFQKSLKQVIEQIPIWIPRNLIMLTNVHLDYESDLARKKGVEMMAEEIEKRREEYKDQLNDVFVFGDFNSPQSSHIFHKFSQVSMQSIRKYFQHKNQSDFCDYKYTFNGFNKKQSHNHSDIIDHMFIHTSVYKPSEFQVIRSMENQPKNPKFCLVSDHFPIMGIFKPVNGNE